MSSFLHIPSGAPHVIASTYPFWLPPLLCLANNFWISVLTALPGDLFWLSFPIALPGDPSWNSCLVILYGDPFLVSFFGFPLEICFWLADTAGLAWPAWLAWRAWLAQPAWLDCLARLFRLAWLAWQSGTKTKIFHAKNGCANKDQGCADLRVYCQLLRNTRPNHGALPLF